MSVVTNVILKTAVAEDYGIQILNSIFESGQGFVACDDPALPRGWYAGSKMLECEIYPGSFNYLDIESLVRAIQYVNWRNPDSVQLFVQEQEENRFKEIPLDL